MTSKSDQIFKEMEFLNFLMPFWNKYQELVNKATFLRLKTGEDYDMLIFMLNTNADAAEASIKSIPEEVSDDFRSDAEQFLQKITEHLRLIAERNKHLKGKSLGTERYSFFDDGKYRKELTKKEKEINMIGERMNRHKQRVASYIGL